MDKESQEIYRMMGELATFGEVSEAIGDNVVDNMMADMARATSVELSKFVASLLNTNLNTFMHSYQMPQYEEFRGAFRMILSRYQVMDGLEQGDLFQKIENMFKDLFIRHYSALGPEVSEVIARRYATQMIEMLKVNSIRANVDMDSDRDGVYY